MEKKCTVEKVYPRSGNTIVPTLLQFQNGNLNSTTRVEYCTMTNRRKGSKEALVAIGDQIYTGEINASEHLVDTYICVRNKSTNKVRILPLDHASLQNFVYTDLRKKEMKAPMTPMNEELNRKKLAKEYQGRKAASAYDTGATMQVNVDVIKDDLDVTVQETEIQNEKSPEAPEKSHLKGIFPKCNKDAMVISEVYDLNDLIPTNILDRLDTEAKAVYDANVKTLPIKSKYLLSCIEDLKKDDQKRSEALQKIKIIIFMDCLYNFIKSKERKVKDIELSGITEKIEFYVRRTFLGEAFKNSTLSDKALCYYIVLCLFISEKYSVNIAMLAEELGKSKNDIQTYAHLVNAIPLRSQSDVATLRLPKQVPALKGTFRRKDRKR